MQHSSLEWLYRVWTEPQRLAPRYFGDAVWMTRYLTVQVAVHFRGRRREHLRVSLDSIGSVAIVSVSGAMAGSGLTALENVLSTGLDCGGSVVLDLTETTHMGADGLWTMVGLLRRAVNRGCEVCLCGLSPSLRRTLKAANFEGLFRSAISSLEAVRLISPGRLQISLDLGDGWALCRIRGDLPVGGRATLEDICHGLRRAHANVVFDTSGAAGFDPAILAWPAALIRPVKYVDGRAPRVQGAA
jgi:anti-anti-sigma factor